MFGKLLLFEVSSLFRELPGFLRGALHDFPGYVV